MTAKNLFNSKTKLRKIITAMLCIAVLLFCLISEFKKSSVPADSGEDYVKFIDVGQGDSILIHSNGYSALIDTGATQSENDLCMDLKDGGIERIDVLMLTHLHSDHTGGTRKILENFSVESLILPEISTFSDGLSYAQFAINHLTKLGKSVFTATQGMNFKIGDFTLTVLCCYDMAEENNRSIVCMAEIYGIKFLLTGDAEKKTENALISDGINVDCDVLKLGHHGSNTSTGEKFLKFSTPSYAVISVGEGNSYGHPHKDVINALNERQIQIFRTDKQGDITFFIENGNLKTVTER